MDTAISPGSFRVPRGWHAQPSPLTDYGALAADAYDGAHLADSTPYDVAASTHHAYEGPAQHATAIAIHSTTDLYLATGGQRLEGYIDNQTTDRMADNPINRTDSSGLSRFMFSLTVWKNLEQLREVPHEMASVAALGNDRRGNHRMQRYVKTSF
jgi:hypothetical protein